MKRNESKHTSAAEAQLNILRHLNKHAPDSVHTLGKATLGYAAYPDYNFKAPQGAAFSVAKIVHAMEKAGWVNFYSGLYGRGYHITAQGKRHLAELEAAQPTVLAGPASVEATAHPAADPVQAKGQHRTPCKECPWRTASAPGWLGASSPLQFLAQAESETKMPCHCAVNYERDDWQDQVETAPRCAGHAIYLRNRCKLPHDPSLAAFVSSVQPSAAVFGRPDAFVAHHGGDVSRVPAVLLGMDTGD